MASDGGLAEAVERDFWTTPDGPWVNHFAPDYDDLQAAFERACDRQDVDVAGLTGNALLRLDHLRNVNPPVRTRGEAASALVPLARDDAAVWLWNCVSPHGLIALAGVSRMTAAREAVAAWRRLGRAQDLYIALGSSPANAPKSAITP